MDFLTVCGSSSKHSYFICLALRLRLTQSCADVHLREQRVLVPERILAILLVTEVNDVRMWPVGQQLGPCGGTEQRVLQLARILLAHTCPLSELELLLSSAGGELAVSILSTVACTVWSRAGLLLSLVCMLHLRSSQ